MVGRESLEFAAPWCGQDRDGGWDIVPEVEQAAARAENPPALSRFVAARAATADLVFQMGRSLVGVRLEIILIHVCDGADRDGDHDDRGRNPVDARSARLECDHLVEAGHDTDGQEGRHETGYGQDLRHDPWGSIFQVGERHEKWEIVLYKIIQETDQLVDAEEGVKGCCRTNENGSEAGQDVPIHGRSKHEKECQKDQADQQEWKRGDMRRRHEEAQRGPRPESGESVATASDSERPLPRPFRRSRPRKRVRAPPGAHPTRRLAMAFANPPASTVPNAPHESGRARRAKHVWTCARAVRRAVEPLRRFRHAETPSPDHAAAAMPSGFSVTSREPGETTATLRSAPAE